MKRINYCKMDKTIGIIGGGQLGKMLLQYCSTINLTTHVYDPNPKSPCKNICTKFFNGRFMDCSKLIEFGRKCDILTYELEHINVEALQQLEKEGIPVYPCSKTLRIIQNKWRQKQFLKDTLIPTCDYRGYQKVEDIRKDIVDNIISLPCVWKKTTFGYDGFGVKVIRNLIDIDEIPECECIIEDYVEIEKELSVIVARNPDKETNCYPPVEMIFNNETNQLEYVFQPANISIDVYNTSMEISEMVSNEIDHVGVLAIELFLTKNGDILVNELAPRPHNSGHLTIEGCCPTSQFEQHIRCVLNLPLGKTEFIEPAVMINIVGDEMTHVHNNINEVFKWEKTYLHDYGKDLIKPNRKMGHVTIVGGDNLLVRAGKFKKLIMKNSSNTDKNQLQYSKNSIIKTESETTEFPKVGLIMGSTSDLPIMKQAIEILKELNINYEVDIVSAHRTPEKMMEYGKTAHTRGLSIIIAGAGGAAHLPGMMASLTPLPVIGVPIKSSNSIDGWDSILSILQMPSGVPVATVALNGAKNAALLAIKILGTQDQITQEKMIAYQDGLKEKVLDSCKEIDV